MKYCYVLYVSLYSYETQSLKEFVVRMTIQIGIIWYWCLTIMMAKQYSFSDSDIGYLSDETLVPNCPWPETFCMYISLNFILQLHVSQLHINRENDPKGNSHTSQ